MTCYKIGVVGAGIIGATTSFVLQKAGHQITLFDPYPPGRGGASFGNAGHIAASDILPLSGPGIISKGARMWLSETGGLKLSPLTVLQNANWFWRFWRTAYGDNFGRAHAALCDLGRSCLAHTQELYKTAQLDHLLTDKGVFFIYDSARSQQNSAKGWVLKAKAGFNSQTISKGQLHDDVPGLNQLIGHAIYSPDWQMVSDPHLASRGFADAALSMGATLFSAEVTQIRHGATGVIIKTVHGDAKFDYLVVSAGVGACSLAKKLGDTVPVIAERGYNVTFPNANIEPSKSLVFADRGIVATHVAGGLRIGGWAEYAPANAPPRDDYFKILNGISRTLFPQLNRIGVKSWMGARPSTPDSVPVISPSSHSPRILYNCGHGHYGLTHATGSALRVLDLILGGEKFDHDHFSIQRFLPRKMY